jgi:hypothetical protein
MSEYSDRVAAFWRGETQSQKHLEAQQEKDRQLERLQADNEVLRAEVKRLGERCAVCKRAGRLLDRPYCAGRLGVIASVHEMMNCHFPADGLCDLPGKFEPKEAK